MATITLSDAAPKVDGAIGFTLANAELELKAGDSYDTEGVENEALLISTAVVNPWLKVKFPDPVAQDAQPGYDPNDPHDNPAADHLTPQASPEVKEAADKADAAIQAAAFPNNVKADDVAEADVAADEKADAPKTTPTVTAATPAATPNASATSTPTTSGASS